LLREYKCGEPVKYWVLPGGTSEVEFTSDEWHREVFYLGNETDLQQYTSIPASSADDSIHLTSCYKRIRLNADPVEWYHPQKMRSGQKMRRDQIHHKPV
jgi:hypothetical protein